MTVEKLAVKLFSSSRKLSQTSSVISRNQTVFFRYTHVHVKYEYIGKERGTINKLHTCDLISGRDFRVQKICIMSAFMLFLQPHFLNSVYAPANIITFQSNCVEALHFSAIFSI